MQAHLEFEPAAIDAFSPKSAPVGAVSVKSPRWQAVGLVIDQNTRDLLARRYGILEEVVSWFKSIALFRQAENERMIERKPTPADMRHHKTWLTTLIAEGERLLNEIRDDGAFVRNKASIKLVDVEATVEELYDTFAEWHGDTKAGQRAALLKQIPLRP